MIIKKMKATFGNLEGSELELKAGLNIVTAPNEAGKSTWMAFIRAMFYGIDTTQRDKGGVLADKNRYRPWSGAQMAGTMEIEAEGKDIILTRETASAAAPMRKFAAVYRDTGDELKSISSESAGLRLLGMEQSVFRRTCFIGQRDVDVSRAPELEKRIENLVTTGDEGASYTQADERLREWERGINYTRSGELPKVNAELGELESRMARQREMNRSSGELRSRIRRLAETKTQLEMDVQLARQLDKAEDVKKRFDAFTARETALENKKQADSKFEKYLRIPLRGELEESLRLLDEAEKLDERTEEAWGRLTLLSDELAAAGELADAAALYEERDPEQVFRRAQQESADAAALLKKSGSAGMMALGIVILVLGAGAAVWGVAAGMAALIAAGGAAAAAGVVLAILGIYGRKKARGRYEEILALTGCETPGDIIEKARRYEEKLRDKKAAADRFETKKQELESLDNQLKELRNRAEMPVKGALGDEFREENIRGDIAEMLENISRQSDAGARLREAESVVSAVGEYAGEEVVDPASLEKPQVERTQAARELAETRSQLESCTKELGMRDGAVMEIGDPAEMAARFRELTERKAELELRLAAVQGAEEVLRDADRKVRERFSPLLNKRAAEIMEKLTCGRYKTLMLDREFNAQALSDKDTVARNMAYFSSGTRDQLYLAVRLAMCDLVLDKDKNAPVILDDVFAYYDDERMRAALNVLAEYARERQVILFTCQTREGAYMNGKTGTNVIK